MPRTATVPAPPDVRSIDFLTLAHLRWLTPDSSAIHRVAYDRDGQRLFVQFASGADHLYAYDGVSQERFVELATAKSAGAYVAKHIKPKFGCLRAGLTVEPAPAPSSKTCA